MVFKYQKYITRQDLKNNPDTLYVFGDNIVEKGFGGQAKEMRGEPNAIGIPTKMHPGNYPDDFFSNKDYMLALPIIADKAEILYEHLNKGKDVVWPEDGIGTGLADLRNKAPAIEIQIRLIKIFFEQNYGINRQEPLEKPDRTD